MPDKALEMGHNRLRGQGRRLKGPGSLADDIGPQANGAGDVQPVTDPA